MQALMVCPVLLCRAHAVHDTADTLIRVKKSHVYNQWDQVHVQAQSVGYSLSFGQLLQPQLLTPPRMTLARTTFCALVTNNRERSQT